MGVGRELSRQAQAVQDETMLAVEEVGLAAHY
jgi:hypothetical protein